MTTRHRMPEDLEHREMGVRHAAIGVEELVKAVARLGREAERIAKDAKQLIADYEALAPALRRQAGALTHAHRRALEEIADLRGEERPAESDITGQWDLL